MRCLLCYGRKKVYKLGGGFTHVDMGAPEVQCPECKGTGVRKAVTRTREGEHGDALMNAINVSAKVEELSVAKPNPKSRKKKVDA